MRKVELRMNEEYKYKIIKKLVETNGNKQRAAVTLKRSIRQIDRMIAGYKEYGKVKNYLYTIAGNTVKNYYKKKKDIPMEEPPEYENDKNNVEDTGIRLDNEQAVRKLPEELREVAILFFFQELKQREIAELLGIKLSLVKYRIGRAKELLIKNLEVKE